MEVNRVNTVASALEERLVALTVAFLNARFAEQRHPVAALAASCRESPRRPRAPHFDIGAPRKQEGVSEGSGSGQHTVLLHFARRPGFVNGVEATARYRLNWGAAPTTSAHSISRLLLRCSGAHPLHEPSGI